MELDRVEYVGCLLTNVLNVTVYLSNLYRAWGSLALTSWTKDMEKEVQERNSGWDTRLETLDRISNEIESKDRVMDEIQRTYQVFLNFSQQSALPLHLPI